MFTTFTAGSAGNWQILGVTPVTGAPLAAASHLAVAPSAALASGPLEDGWQLTGVASHVRYVERVEKTALGAVQAGLGRAEARLASLIPIKKSAAWWDLTQEERRRIFEDQ
eukprot:gene55872-76591_t